MKNTDQRLTRKDLWHVYRGQFFIRSCLNFERMQNIGFTHAMSPIIEKYYDTPEEKQEAIDRHMQMFLTQPMVASIPIGVSAAMEERLVVDKDIEPESIDSTKTALMGPLAALGDSLINGTARPILAGIAGTFRQCARTAAVPHRYVHHHPRRALSRRIQGLREGRPACC